MSKKHRYSSKDVQQFDVTTVLAMVVAGCIVAIDVAKTGFYAGIADRAGDVASIVRFEHPRQTLVFLELLESLRAAGSSPQIVMEPTGTYGDALRYHCHKRGFQVFMSSPKHTHDMAEVLDGVPSMHDAKAVVVLAKLHAIRPGRLYEPQSEQRRNLRTTVDRREIFGDTLERHYGRLEALLARYWPEFGEHLKVHSQRSWMALLQQLPGPELVAEQPDAAKALLRKASRGMLDAHVVNGVVNSATGSLGVPMTAGEKVQLRELVGEIHRLTAEQDRLDKELERAVSADPVSSRIAETFGPAAAGSVISYLGDPSDYTSAAALEKAAGLNLKVRSSGKYAGQLKITKRGPGIVRRNMHLASLRLIQTDPVVQAWYRARDGYTEKSKLKAVVAVDRKLMRAMWHLAREDVPFDSAKLFDTRRLTLGAPSKPFSKRKGAAAPTGKPRATRSAVTA